MKKLILTSIFILCFSFLTFAQAENLPCPAIVIEGPNSLLNLGETMFFKAITNSENKNIKYKWIVEPGTKFVGQGTPKISIVGNEDLAFLEIKAMVKIEGLPENCINTATRLGVFVGIRDYFPLDTYGKLPRRDEYPRIDNFLITLQNNPDAKGYVLFEVEKNEKLKLVKKHVSAFFKHIKFRKFDRERILFDVCQGERHETSFWIIPKDAPFPKPEKCEEIDIDLR